MTDTANVYIRLFHGRDDPDKDMEDWGFDGPVLGPMRYVHVTYMDDVKFSMRRAEFAEAFPEVFADWAAKGYSNVDQEWIDYRFDRVEDLIAYGGKFYGDWSVTGGPA